MYGVLRVLEVCRRDDDGVEAEPGLRLVEGDVAAERLDFVSDGLLDLRLGVLEEAFLPEVCDGDEVEVQLLVVVEKARQERPAEAVGVADARDAHLFVGARGVERRAVSRGDDPGETGSALAEFTTLYFFHCL